jgi:hypothetical protein
MELPDLSGYSDHQLAALVVIAVSIQVGGLALLIAKMHGTGRDAKAANAQTVKTGNGFAGHVLETLDKIKASAEITQRAVETLQGAHDDVRTGVDEIRSQQEFLRQRVVLIDERQQRHMEQHFTNTQEAPDA